MTSLYGVLSGYWVSPRLLPCDGPVTCPGCRSDPMSSQLLSSPCWQTGWMNMNSFFNLFLPFKHWTTKHRSCDGDDELVDIVGGESGGFGFGWGGWCSGFTVVIFPDKMYVNRGAGLYITVLLRGMRACVRRVSRYLINPVSQSVWLFINACTLSTHLIKPPFNGIKLQNWTCFTAAVVVSGNWTLICMIHMEVMWKHTTMTTHLPHNRLFFFCVSRSHADLWPQHHSWPHIPLSVISPHLQLSFLSVSCSCNSVSGCECHHCLASQAVC